MFLEIVILIIGILICGKEVGTGYSVLKWEYDNNTVEARSKDVNLLYALKECIEMYLEETEKKE